MKNIKNKKVIMDDSEHRHVLGLSGGKDSAALAIYIKDRHPEIHEKMEYFFTDTGAGVIGDRPRLISNRNLII